MIYLATILSSFLVSNTLQEIFDNAPSNGEYQKYIILEPNQIYLGGISGINEDGLNVFIDCQGSTIDLNNQLGIWTYASLGEELNLKVQYCNIINGQYGLYIQGHSKADISNCNFYNNHIGVKIKDYTEVTIENTNFINNGYLNSYCGQNIGGVEYPPCGYGLAIITEEPTVSINYCNSFENHRTYWENCPG
ncbi:MAG: hypothetical protein CMG00_03100 [Candidatus Marinimicrobia bacterium]|nr:hypothetical protein [Candidatus Neomarinimicrobiota bacterium]|tara:strand:+ start:7597 stop:8172 length:576 start_codon:yes stop_codon:yes gene_type:complete